MIALMRRLGGFALLPALSMLASLVLLPLIAHYDGAAGWTGMAIGTSAGALVSVVGGLAWPIIGAQRVVNARTVYDRRRIFALSLASRGVLIAAALVVATPLVVELTDFGQKSSAVAFLFATSMSGLSASWYYAGTGQPRHLVVNEGLTRFFGYLAAVVMVLITHRTFAYALSNLTFVILALLLNCRTIFGSLVPPRVPWQDIVRVHRMHLPGTISRIAMSMHSFAPPTLLSAMVPGALPVFTAVDNIYKSGCNAVSFLPSALIEWMQEGGVLRARRRRGAVIICVVVAILVIVVWQMIGNRLLGLLYQGKAEFSAHVVLAIGISVALALLVSVTELLLLVPKGLEHRVYQVEMIVSIVGILLVVPMAMKFGAVGAFVTYAIASLLKVLAFALAEGLTRDRAN